jgi:hypothetical protein
MDRFEEGMEAEEYGRYYQASMRYVDALDKDEDLLEAQDRASTQDPVGAGMEFQRLDRLLRATRRVNVSLPLPAGFADLRRSTFDGAIEALMVQADEAYERGAWGPGREALQRIRADFEPDGPQRAASLEADARILLAWAQDEERNRRYRRAFDRAGELLAMSAPLPRTMADEAEAVQARALDLGTRYVAIFPVDVAPDIRGQTEEHPGLLLSDMLEVDYWREPPAFVAVADPVRVRQLTRRYAPPGVPLRPGRVLSALDAHYGVLIEIRTLHRSEQNVRSQVRTATTSGGGTARYTLEEGDQRYEVRAEVVLVDEFGARMESFRASEDTSGPFRRAVYDGDVRDLDLSRSERMLFDPVPQAQARAELESRLMVALARRIGPQVFERIVRRIP